LNNLPVKPNGGPNWLTTEVEIDPAGVAKGLYQTFYWNAIRKKAIEAALNRIKKDPEYSLKKTFEKQSSAIHHTYEEYVEEEQALLEEKLKKDNNLHRKFSAEAWDQSFDKIDWLTSIAEQTQMVIVEELSDNDLFDEFDVSTPEEYLAMKIDLTSGSQRSDFIFIQKHLLPLLRANGFPEELLINVTQNYKKARLAVPYLRQVLDEILQKTAEIQRAMAEAEEDEKDFLEQALEETMQMDTRMKDILEALMIEITLQKKDGGLSQREFLEKIQKLYRGAPEPEKCDGYSYTMKHGGILTIITENNSQFRTLQRTTAHIVNWMQGDPADLAREVGKRILDE